MQTMVPLYGFGGGSGGTGATLTVTAPSGCTVTVTKDGKTKTKVADSSGLAVFRGLASGEWTISITDGEQTAQKTVTITADYSTAITFFAATIHITYPAGSTCTATDGVTTLTAPNTSGTWDIALSEPGTWTVALDRGYREVIAVTKSGEYTVNKWHLYNSGDQCNAATGGLVSETIGNTSLVSPTFGDDDITISYSRAFGTANKSCAVRPSNTINLTNISALTVRVTTKTGGSNYSKLGVSKTAPNAASPIKTYPENYAAINSTGLISLDVSALSGAYYVFFGSCSYWGEDADMNQKIVIEDMYVS